MQDLSHQSLVGRCINGDKVAWNTFVERFSQLIYWAIKKRLNHVNYGYNQQDFEDIFQNVFVLLCKKGKLQQIRNRENISGWLAMVAANCAVNYFRNKRKEFVREELALEKIESSDCPVAGALGRKRLHAILEEAFNFISGRERIILKLNYLYDKTHQEIGRILKMPTNTVSSIIKRTKERLQKKLEKEGFKIS